ncbi:hypothetical protein K439DRAFT_1625113 [Ramaria rubella]|nr:hypothetical protein K439DRAFT_1625113 [Ramaria rubella]
MAERPRGRPPKKYTPRGRLAAKLRRSITELFSHSSPEPPSEGEATAPNPPSRLEDGVRLLNPDESQFVNLASQHFGRPLSAFASSYTEAPLFLDTIRRNKPEWKNLGHIPHWFDAQVCLSISSCCVCRLIPFLLSSTMISWKAHVHSDCVTVSFFGHPSDSPIDIRARQFIVRWTEPSPLSLPAREEAISRKRVVLRWEYRCRGICSVVDSPTDEGTQDDSSEDEAGSGNAPEVPAKQGRWDLCDGGIEITAEDLTTATIWQFGKHPDAKPERGLHWSRRLRNLVSERLRLGGAKVSTIQKELVAQYNFPAQTSRHTNAPTHIPLELPEFRRPTARHLRSMFPAVRRRERLHKDPFEAVHLLHERNPEKIYNYTPHDRHQPDAQSEFTCAITDKHALERLILYGIRDGIGCDTSWRNKNKNRAAVTFLTVVDSNGHLAPGSALLSANIQTDTLVEYLRATTEQVIKRARKIVENPDDVSHTAPGDREEILPLAEVILKDGWNVLKWIIDKCRAELKATKKGMSTRWSTVMRTDEVLEAFPGAIIRICQFHIIQAILRWDCSNGKIAKAPRISARVKLKLCVHFRKAQRCRTHEEWPAYQKNFMVAAKKTIMEEDVDEDTEESESGDSSDLSDNSDSGGSPSLATKTMEVDKRKSTNSRAVKLRQWEFVKNYFPQNWFTEEWLEHITDIGLPPGQTRDDT